MVNPNIAFQVRGPQIEPREEALMRALQLVGAQRQNALGMMQMQGLQQQQAQAQAQQNALSAFRQQMPSPQMESAQNALSAQPNPAAGPTRAAAGMMAPVDPRMQAQWQMMQAGVPGFGPAEYMAKKFPERKPIKLGAGDVLVDGNNPTKPLFSAPAAPKAPPAAVQEYEFAKSQGFPGSFQDWTMSQKRAGATNISLNTEKGLLGTVADLTGKDIVSTADNARGAQGSLNTVQQIRGALASNKAITGTAANQRVFLAQFGETLGLGPADAPETLQQTRELMMSLGQLELDAAAQMKGQGQITESERAILRRAAAGDITLTAPELTTIANVTERRAKSAISRNQKNMEQLKRMPNASSVVPFLEANGQPADFKMPTAQDIAAEAARRRALRGGN